MIYGYVRVSTTGQMRDGNSLEEQAGVILDRYPNAKTVEEAYSGAKVRPVFTRLIESLSVGDTLVVTKLDRFCRSTKEGLQYIDELMSRGVQIHILNMGLIENTPMGRMIVTQLLAFAEFERSMIFERTQSGKAMKKQKNPDYREGRKGVVCPEFKSVYDCYKQGLTTITDAAKELKISRQQWYRLVEKITE